MNKITFLSVATSALLLFASCSKDKDETVFQPEGTYAGTFNSFLVKTPYAIDTTTTKVVINNDKNLSITIGNITASPGTVMDSMVLTNIPYTKDANNIITFSSSNLQGEGTMYTKKYTLDNSNITNGKIEKNRISFEMSFHFGHMPFNINANFKGMK